MKKLICTGLLLVAAAACFGQAKKPTLMVVPSDLWCVKNGYVINFDNQGVIEQLPDYTKALQNDAELLLVISKLGELMANREFPLKDLEASLKRLKTEEAEEALTMSKETGSGVAESPLDKLKRVAKADIWMQVTWTINQVGPKQSITFNLQGKDAYTDKQVAATSGTSAADYPGETAVVLEASIGDYLPNFVSQLQASFDDLRANGREITLVCRRWADSEVDFESEFDGQELGQVIEAWVAENTVQSRFSTSDASENRMFFEQVRIPLYNASNRAIDARAWSMGLRQMLREKYSIDSKVSMKGLGQAILTIGGK